MSARTCYLADQLAAAKELVEFAEEKHRDQLTRLRLAEKVTSSRTEFTTDEDIARREALLERVSRSAREAEQELKAARRKVKELAEQISK